MSICKERSPDPRLLGSTQSSAQPSAFSSMAPSRSNSESSCANAVASASHGRAYLNMSSSSIHCSTEYAEADCPTEGAHDRCTTLLTTVQQGALGEAISRDQWQPDSFSALCSFPLCTTKFGPAGQYFTLAPRRHHCRLCGHLFCGDHSSRRAPLVQVENQGKRAVLKQRVCDTCIDRPEPEGVLTSVRSRRSSMWSEHTESTNPSDIIVTPEDEYAPSMSSSALLACTQSLSRCTTRANLDGATADAADELAPVESWMGPAGILSLYPLAVNASHAQTKASAAPAAGPLFAPSLSARRSAKEKELERLSLRQRRLGADKSFWIPGTWGYRREDFDPTYFDADVEGEDCTEGGLVIDGPIRLRAQAKKITSPALSRVSSIRTPSEERKVEIPTF